MSWQPIETAPKTDETFVDLWNEAPKFQGRVVDCFWDSVRGWVHVCDDSYQETVSEKYITHWMPLPEPPK